MPLVLVRHLGFENRVFRSRFIIRVRKGLIKRLSDRGRLSGFFHLLISRYCLLCIFPEGFPAYAHDAILSRLRGMD